MSTIAAIVIGLVLAFPFTWALQGVYLWLAGSQLDASAASATDMRLIIVIVLLCVSLFRARRPTLGPPPSRGAR